VFARYFVELPLVPEQVENALLADPQTWLPGIAQHANHRGDELLAEVGFGEDVRIARTVSIDLARPVHMPTKTVLPLRWQASGSKGLFPSLDADLEIAALSPERAQLAISARYVPPLGVVGRAIDRALLFRVAEATLKDFLDQVAKAVMSSVGDDAPDGAGTGVGH
jgi:hypothetical protein